MFSSGRQPIYLSIKFISLLWAHSNSGNPTLIIINTLPYLLLKMNLTWKLEILRELHFTKFQNPLNGVCTQVGMHRKDEQLQLEAAFWVFKQFVYCLQRLMRVLMDETVMSPGRGTSFGLFSICLRTEMVTLTFHHHTYFTPYSQLRTIRIQLRL